MDPPLGRLEGSGNSIIITFTKKVNTDIINLLQLLSRYIESICSVYAKANEPRVQNTI